MRPIGGFQLPQFGPLHSVRLAGKSSVRSASQHFNLATAVPFAGDPEVKIHATTKPQRAVQAGLERTRMRLRLVQQFSPCAPPQMQPLASFERRDSGSTWPGRQSNYRCSGRPAAAAELIR